MRFERIDLWPRHLPGWACWSPCPAECAFSLFTHACSGALGSCGSLLTLRLPHPWPVRLTPAFPVRKLGRSEALRSGLLHRNGLHAGFRGRCCFLSCVRPRSLNDSFVHQTWVQVQSPPPPSPGVWAPGAAQGSAFPPCSGRAAGGRGERSRAHPARPWQTPGRECRPLAGCG